MLEFVFLDIYMNMNENLTNIEGMSGRLVDFPSRRGKAWGVELDYTLTELDWAEFKKVDLNLLKRIKRVKIVNLDPQENLLIADRNILPKNILPFSGLTLLQQLVEFPREKAVKYLAKAIKIVFKDDLFHFAEHRFMEKMKETQGETLVLIFGHGGQDPWTIGEQGSNDVRDKSGTIIQKKGNDINYKKILRHYNDPKKFAGIIFLSCYLGKKDLQRLRVPAARIVGHYRDRDRQGLEGYLDQWRFQKTQVA